MGDVGDSYGSEGYPAGVLAEVINKLPKPAGTHSEIDAGYDVRQHTIYGSRSPRISTRYSHPHH
jgi:hypothetical protein